MRVFHSSGWIEFPTAVACAGVYATALRCEAEPLTSDADLAGLPGVTYIARP